eukprot:610584-Pelagomonas_calceolata.AAC.2
MHSTLCILSGCQCPVIRNMVTERHNIASRMVLKVVSEGSYGPNLTHMDVGSADRPAQRDLHITEQITNRVILPYLFEPSIPDQTRRNSSRPDAILVTPCPTNPNRPPTSPSHLVLRSMRRNEEVKSNATPARQLRELNIQNRHIHLIEIKYCEDTRPASGAQLEASRQQHNELCKQLQGAEISLILLGVGGTIYTAHTLDQLRNLDIDPQRSTKLARKLHAHSVQYAHRLTSTRRANENKNTHSGALGPHASRNPPDPRWFPSYPLVRETHRSLSQCVSFSFFPLLHQPERQT